ncbi:MAG: hypothetical protein ABI193_20510 [Minicystis sp.]
MKATTLIPLSATLLLAAACGGTEATGSSTSSTSAGSGGSTGSGGGATTATTTTSGGGGEDAGEVVTLTLSSFTVPPGGEVYKCQNFKNPFKGADAEITRFESHMTKGSHHMLLFYKKTVKEDGPLDDCSGLEFAATPYSTQLPDDELSFPEGVAGLLSPDRGLRVQSHYLNVTEQPIEAHVEVKLHLAKPGTVTDHAGILFVVEPAIDIAPNSMGVVQHDCGIPYDMNLIKATSHMHKHGTSFSSTIGGEKIFDTNTWDDPKPVTFEPGKPVKANAPLHFECHFTNNSAETLTFGESAQNNEMCIFVAAFYPIPPGGLTTVDCHN